MTSDPIAAAYPSAFAPPAGRGRLSPRMVGQLAAGEQFVVWALRQRMRDAAPASTILVQGFRLAFGLGDLEPALAAFEGCFQVLATPTAPGRPTLGPLRCACLTSDEEVILGLVAGARVGQADQVAEALVEAPARAGLRGQAALLSAALARSGLALPLPLPARGIGPGRWH